MLVSRSQTSTSGGRGRPLRTATAFLVLLCVAGYALAQYLTGSAGSPRCTVRAADGQGGGDYELEPRQAANAATITAVASQRGLPERAVTIALATAMQESGLRNIGHGDRDSVGLFQQRPSQGWGTARQIQDPVYASGEFYTHLTRIPDYSQLPLTVAAQRVQHSGFPRAYAKHEPDAALLTSALTGRRAASFSCTTQPADQTRVRAGSAEQVRHRLVREFGTGVLPGGDRGPGATGGSGRRSAPESQLTVASRGSQRDWELAHWMVAHADELRVDRIALHGRVWRADRSREGWHPDPAASAAAGRSAVTVRLTSGH